MRIWDATKVTPAVLRVHDRMRKASANVWGGFMMRLRLDMMATVTNAEDLAASKRFVP